MPIQYTDITKENRLNKEIKKMTAVAEEYNEQIQARKFLEENKIIGESKIYLDCVNKALKVTIPIMVLLGRERHGKRSHRGHRGEPPKGQAR